MNAGHEWLLGELRQAARPITSDAWQNDSYGGSGRPFYNVSAPTRREIVRRWLRANPGISRSAVLTVVESLTEGKSHEEKTLAAILIAADAETRRRASPDDIERWLGRLNGWAEIDCLCQNVFQAEDFLGDWPRWKGLVVRLSRDRNINKRRASLVLLNASVRYSRDPRLRDLAFGVIERLEGERDILITKAVSWLLRSMVGQHREAVEAYLAAHGPSLPRIAVRETRMKLTTGVKSGRSRSQAR
jgi:3-methyladenine DNA glycosylase AlkD